MRLLLSLSLISSLLTAFAQPGAFTKNNNKPLNKLKTNVTIGSQVGMDFNKSYWLTSYVSPSFSYSLSDKITLIGGIGFANTQLNGSILQYSGIENNSVFGNYNTVYGYAGGIYKLSKKLNVSAVYTFDTNIRDSNVPAMNHQIKSGTFGLHYRVSSFLSFDAQINLGNNPCNTINGYNFNNIQHNGFNSIINSPYY